MQSCTVYRFASSIVHYVTFASSFSFQLRSCKDKTRIFLSTYLAHARLGFKTDRSDHADSALLFDLICLVTA